MVSKRCRKSKWQDVEIAGAANTAPPYRIPLRRIRMPCLARKFVWPWQRRLVGEAFKENLRAIGVSGVTRQFQVCAPLGRHRLLYAEYLKRRAPPPGRGRRSRFLRDGAPSDVLIHGAFELQIRGLMHRSLQTTDDTRLCNCRQCDVLKTSQC